MLVENERKILLFPFEILLKKIPSHFLHQLEIKYLIICGKLNNESEHC